MESYWTGILNFQMNAKQNYVIRCDLAESKYLLS